MNKFSLIFFKKYLFSKKVGSVTKIITWLCLGGISVSVMAMTVIISVMGGFGDAIEGRLLSFEPHLVVKSKSEDARFSKNDIYDFVEHLKSPEVQAKTPLEAFSFDQEQVIFRTPAGNYSGALARGLEEKSLKHFIQASRVFAEKNVKRFSWEEETDSDIIIQDDDILVGHDLSIMAGVYPGTQLVLTPPESMLLPSGEVPEVQTLNVQDILRTGFQSIDTQIILYKKKTQGSLFKDSASRESLVEIYLKNPDHLDKLIHGIDKKKFEIQTWKERNSSLFYSLKMEKLLISIFLFLAILIGSFTIVTILVLLITQKRKDIGILMVMGMKQKNIVGIFSNIGFYLSGVGVFIGFAIGLFICVLIANQTFIELPDFYQDRTLPVRFEVQSYALILGLSLIISFLSSYYPARLISSISPQDLFRSKSR